MRGIDVLQEARLELLHAVQRHIVQEALRAGVDAHHLLLDRHRLVLRLLEQFDQARAAVELPLRGLVQFGAELGEGFQLAVGGQVEPQRAGDSSSSP